jgi:hypothetical protein
MYEGLFGVSESLWEASLSVENGDPRRRYITTRALGMDGKRVYKNVLGALAFWRWDVCNLKWN